MASQAEDCQGKGEDLMTVYNIYCDESCHLENDHQDVMVLGAIWCPSDSVRTTNTQIREIKKRHGLSSTFEIKWTKVSPGKRDFYLDLVDYFFQIENLHFRALVVPDKSKLRHKHFHQTHDTWYYKMYFDMLKIILEPDSRYRIYLDIKDTRSADKTAKLHDVLCNNFYDFERNIIERVQTVRSHEIELVQLADLLIGAVSYVNRGLRTNSAKTAVIEKFKMLSGYTLVKTNLLRETKVNIFVWHPGESGE